MFVLEDNLFINIRKIILPVFKSVVKENKTDLVHEKADKRNKSYLKPSVRNKPDISAKLPRNQRQTITEVDLNEVKPGVILMSKYTSDC